ncbi:hypothetical protein [Rhizobium sp. FKL33]|uniref:hypothetical protein n=1 Tax=Rhizobium sp. FKL33 TaxID=2562307 RepID=UPI0010BF75FE|nr:hypothetical protein [Rhizobium sp. FKL33]
MSSPSFKKRVGALPAIFFEDPPKKILPTAARRIFDTLGLKPNNIAVQSLGEGPDHHHGAQYFTTNA